jgi:DNA gyrase/topoisomerase IV subunit B
VKEPHIIPELHTYFMSNNFLYALPINHRGSANLRLYTKERREKKFYCHATWAWGYSGIRTFERRLSFSSAVVKSRSRSYVVLYQKLSIDTGQTIFQTTEFYYSAGIVVRVPNLSATASGINKEPFANLVQGEEEKAQASFAKFPHKKICEVLESIL